MTLTTPYSATFIVGDGETKTFSYLFEEVSPNFISVMVYNSLTGLISTPTYIIDTDQKQVIFGEDTPAPTADETVCIYRNTPNVQDVAFRTLHGYDAQTLENILSKIVAMIQEIKSNYFSTQVLQGDPWQLDLLSSADDGATVNIDYTAKKLVKGLYFRITSGNLQVSADGTNYITMPKSDDVAEFRQYEQTLPDLTVIHKLQYRVGNQWFDAEANAQGKADSAYSLAESVQTTVNAHINNTQNPHQTSMNNLTDTEITNLSTGQFLMFSGGKWKNVYSSATASWGTLIGNITDQTDLFDTFVKKTGDTLTGMYNHAYGSRTRYMAANSTTKYADVLMNDDALELYYHYSNSIHASLYARSYTGYMSLYPGEDNLATLGLGGRRWGRIYVTKLCPDTTNVLTLPNETGVLATKADVDLAANSGDQLTEKGVWYAKMYSATVAPSAEDGTNYADFSQTDNQGNPIIVIYKRQNGAWVQDQTITPPAEYNGYVPVTSKIWDIVEQAGQQGGKVLWSHNQKTFTPSPLIISFEDIEITGDSTVVMPQNPGTNQIVNKNYVDEAIAAIPTPTVDIAQSIDADIVGTLTVANNGDVSGLDYSNYLVYPGALDMSDASSFEMVFAFTTGNAVSTAYVLNGAGMGYGSEHDIAITINSSEKLYFYVNASSDIITGITTIQPNTKYYVKVVYDGTDYILSLSEDGNNWNTEGSVLATEKPGPLRGRKYAIGRSVASVFSAMHMKECYIKENNILVWQGMDAPGLHQRVDINASNVSALGKLNIIDMIMPDYASATDITLSTSQSYTATKPGYISFIGTSNGTIAINVNGVTMTQASWASGKTMGAWVMVASGNTVTISQSSGQAITVNQAKFIPCKGA